MTVSINIPSAKKPDSGLLLSLLASIHLSALPLYKAMPATIIILIAGVTIWQIFLIIEKKSMPGKLIQLFMILITVLIVLYSYGNIFGQRPGLALVVLMTLLKLFETRTSRDCYIVIYSAIFIIASNFFHSQSIWMILYVFIFVGFLLSLLIALSDRLNSVSFHTRITMATRLIIYALPLMLVLFILFPRIPGPLWGLPADTFSSQTGLSEQMSPGSINRLINSSAIAFRVKFNGTVPEHKQRYWRGAVLSLYDGKTWRRSDAPEKAKANIKYDSSNRKTTLYSITLEPTNLSWLLSLEYPVSYDHKYSFNREAMLITKNKISNVINYVIESQTNASNQAMFAQESFKNRSLPRNLNPKTVSFARQLFMKSDRDVQQYINNVLSYFTNNNFVYTLNPDLLGDHAMDDFLFNSRRGFCEHYASAFVYLMRAADVPSRIVIGYQGGTMNPLDDYMIVRQSDAHAWAEVWLDNHWTRVDPTAAVSSDRVERGVQFSGLEGDRLPLLLVSGSSFIKNAGFLYDSFQNSWNQWVIGFNQKKQNDLLKYLGFNKATSSNLILLLVSCLSIAGFIITWLLFKQRPTVKDPVQQYYNVFCEKLQRNGVLRGLHEGPADFEQRVCNRLDMTTPVRNDVLFIFEAYRNLHYGNQNNLNLLKRYIRKIKTLRLDKNRFFYK